MCISGGLFQSTLPRRERHPVLVLFDQSKIFQSTLPRRERLKPFIRFLHASTISIHAPAKGATHRFRHWRYSTGFQSTLPRRERHALDAVQTAWNVISIHAPAKGATNYSEYVGRRVKISIHAPAKGATRYHNTNRNQYRFQSTLPRRERQIRGKKPLNPFPHFNPRSREGSDFIS